MQRFQPYLSLSPEAAWARAKTARGEEKTLLEQLAGRGWAAIQLHFRLTPADRTAMRAGRALTVSTRSGPGRQVMPPSIAHGLVQARGR